MGRSGSVRPTRPSGCRFDSSVSSDVSVGSTRREATASTRTPSAAHRSATACSRSSSAGSATQRASTTSGAPLTTETAASPLADDDRGPLPRRLERKRVERLDLGRDATLGAGRKQRAIDGIDLRRRCGGRSPQHVVRPAARGRLVPLEPQPVLGQRPGLVGADDGRLADRLDRREGPHDRAALRHLTRAERERDRHRRGKPLGHRGNRDRDSDQERVSQRLAARQHGGAEDDGDTDAEHHHPARQPTEPGLQRGRRRLRPRRRAGRSRPARCAHRSRRPRPSRSRAWRRCRRRPWTSAPRAVPRPPRRAIPSRPSPTRPSAGTRRPRARGCGARGRLPGCGRPRGCGRGRP